MVKKPAPAYLQTAIDNSGDLAKRLRVLADTSIMVGVPEAYTRRKPEKGQKSSHRATNSLISYVMEHGYPAGNIPARPYLAPGIRGVHPQIVAALRAAGRAALNGESVDRLLQRMAAIGQLAVNAVQAKMASNIPPPLSKRTIAGRIRRGRKPPFRTLWDTGQLIRSISYVLRDRRGNTIKLGRQTGPMQP